MKRVIQAVASNLWPEDIEGWRRWCERLILHDSPQDLQSADPEIPLLGGLNLAQKEYRAWMAAKRPYICFNRPHLGGWSNAYQQGFRRVSINSYACTVPATTSSSRWPLMNLPQHRWKVHRVKNVLIAPPAKSIWYTLGQTADQWAQQQAIWFAERGAVVRVRSKTQAGKGKGGRYASLWSDLDWADLIVSYSSAITMEAFWYGKKVLSAGVCPTWMCGTDDFETWNDPTEPHNRDQWHEHAAWTQFSGEEWRTGQAQDMLMEYQGHAWDQRPRDNF